MKTHHLWIEIVILGSAIAFAVALLLASLGAAAGALGPEQTTQATPEKAYTGMVSCSSCGARHSAALGRSAVTCTRICVHGGASFVLVAPDSTYFLDGDSSVLKAVAGRRARVVGTLSQQTIRIFSITAEA